MDEGRFIAVTFMIDAVLFDRCMTRHSTMTGAKEGVQWT